MQILSLHYHYLCKQCDYSNIEHSCNLCCCKMNHWPEAFTAIETITLIYLYQNASFVHHLSSLCYCYYFSLFHQPKEIVQAR